MEHKEYCMLCLAGRCPWGKSDTFQHITHTQDHIGGYRGDLRYQQDKLQQQKEQQQVLKNKTLTGYQGFGLLIRQATAAAAATGSSSSKCRYCKPKISIV
jgi:hypothetical protein